MFKNTSRCLALIFFSAGISRAQVVSPNEINDPALRSLQVQFSYELNKVGSEILATKFAYPFYLSRRLDLQHALQLASKTRRDPKNPYRVNLEKWRPSHQLIRRRNARFRQLSPS